MLNESSSSGLNGDVLVEEKELLPGLNLLENRLAGTTLALACER